MMCLTLDERNSIAKLHGVPFATAAALTMSCRAMALCLYVTRRHRERQPEELKSLRPRSVDAAQRHLARPLEGVYWLLVPFYLVILCMPIWYACA